MDIKQLQANWDHFGKTEPLWSILTFDDKKGNKWDIHEFFATGEREIGDLMEYIASLHFQIPRKNALDFGCGIGRLTQPLARFFDHVTGVDIAPSMITSARQYNRHGDTCRYVLNDTNDLKAFRDNDFNLIYTNITLQHMDRSFSKNYLREFLRILAPDGLLIFQLPSGGRVFNERGTINIRGLILRIVPKRLLDLTYRRVKFGRVPRMEMYWMRRESVISFLEQNGARIVDVVEDRSVNAEWKSYRYCVTKKSA